MPNFPTVLILVLTAITSACSHAEPPVIKAEIVVPVLPESARTPCKGPAAVPDRAITQGEVTALWGRDRASLKQCEAKRAAAVAAVDAIKAGE